MGLPSRETCTDGADFRVAVPGAADGLCGPGVVAFVPAWEEAAAELDAFASLQHLSAQKSLMLGFGK